MSPACSAASVQTMVGPSGFGYIRLAANTVHFHEAVRVLHRLTSPNHAKHGRSRQAQFSRLKTFNCLTKPRKMNCGGSPWNLNRARNGLSNSVRLKLLLSSLAALDCTFKICLLAENILCAIAPVLASMLSPPPCTFADLLLSLCTEALSLRT